VKSTSFRTVSLAFRKSCLLSTQACLSCIENFELLLEFFLLFIWWCQKNNNESKEKLIELFKQKMNKNCLLLFIYLLSIFIYHLLPLIWSFYFCFTLKCSMRHNKRKMKRRIILNWSISRKTIGTNKQKHKYMNSNKQF
jgi:hypothetical protein